MCYVLWLYVYMHLVGGAQRQAGPKVKQICILSEAQRQVGPDVAGKAQSSGRSPVLVVCDYVWYVVGWGTH